MNSAYFSDDAIFALATAYYPSALAVFRISGKGSLKLLNKILDRPVSAEKDKNLFFRKIKDGGETVDECVVSVFAEGHGYTKEESAELSVHGSIAVIDRLDALFVRVGFRKALKGEFTFRAVRNGVITLTQAEAVKELIDADSDRVRKIAMDNLAGVLDEVFSEIRAGLLQIGAVFELQTDYSDDEYDEQTEFPSRKIASVLESLRLLHESFKITKLQQSGIKIVLAGKTNSGKSTLFNFLLKENRSIVSPVEGTTRDYVSESAEIDGVKVVLYDTAGFNDRAGLIEKEGIDRSTALKKTADIVIQFIESESEMGIKAKNTIYVRNKCDLKTTRRIKGCIMLSAKSGEGTDKLIDEIKNRISFLIKKNDGSGKYFIGSARQDRLICRIIGVLEKLKPDLPPEILGAEIQNALSLLNELTGFSDGREDILDEIFSQFCVGK